LGYICFGLPVQIQPFKRDALPTTQEYEGAADLDIKPAIAGESNQVCRVFAESKTGMHIRLNADTANWTPTTSIKVTVNGPDGAALGSQSFDSKTQGSTLSVQVKVKDFHSIVVDAANTPPQNSTPKFVLSLTYNAPQTL